MKRKDELDVGQIIQAQIEEIKNKLNQGFTGQDVAKDLGIDSKEWTRQYNTNPVLKKAIHDIREENCRHLREALYRKAIGLTTTTTKIIKHTQSDGTTVQIEEVSEIQHPPDVGANIFLLNTFFEKADASFLERHGVRVPNKDLYNYSDMGMVQKIWETKMR